jgi:hypothetical protein
MDALSSGGLHQTGEDAVGFQSAIRSGSETYFAEDHQVPEGLFGIIVGGRYAGAPEEGEEEFLFGSCEESPESLGGFEAKGSFADGVEFTDKAFFHQRNQGRSSDSSETGGPNYGKITELTELRPCVGPFLGKLQYRATFISTSAEPPLPPFPV